MPFQKFGAMLCDYPGPPGQAGWGPNLRQMELIIAFQVAAAIVCECPRRAGRRADSGSSARDYRDGDEFQTNAIVVCQWPDGKDGQKDFEPPDIHMHPEPLPYDYNEEKSDSLGKFVLRHNYH